MAAVEVNAGGAVVKLRRPWMVGVLSLIPLSLLVGASTVPWIGWFMEQSVAAVVVTHTGLPAVVAATVLMPRRLTRLWAAG